MELEQAQRSLLEIYIKSSVIF